MKKIKFEDLTILDYQHLVREFHGESDRAAAVLAGSYVENFIAKYLKFFMANDIDEEKLFHGFGPFATFAQRTEVAYAFNLIDKNMKNDLDYIRVIRNHFAHHPRKISFQSVKITSLCKKLTSAQPKEIIGSDKIHTETDSKSQYLLAIASFVVFAHNSMVVGKIK